MKQGHNERNMTWVSIKTFEEQTRSLFRALDHFSRDEYEDQQKEQYDPTKENEER